MLYCFGKEFSKDYFCNCNFASIAELIRQSCNNSCGKPLWLHLFSRNSKRNSFCKLTHALYYTSSNLSHFNWNACWCWQYVVFFRSLILKDVFCCSFLPERCARERERDREGEMDRERERQYNYLGVVCPTFPSVRNSHFCLVWSAWSWQNWECSNDPWP